MHNIIKENRADPENKFRPYCFPDIPVDDSQDNLTGFEKGNDFQRIGLEKDGRPPAGFFEGCAGNREGFRLTAKEKAGEIEKQVYAQGFLKGEKAGMASERKKVEPFLNNFYQALLELERVKSEICVNAEKETIDLALAIAKKIVGHEVSMNKDFVLGVVKDALKKSVDNDKITVRINPSDLQFIKDARIQFSDYVDNIEKIAFEEDKTILNGGCVIETSLGEIDARIDKQFQAVEEAFRSQFQESGVGG